MVFRIILPIILPVSLWANWPQYHGPNLDKSTDAANFTLPPTPLTAKIIWKTDTPLGFSSVSTYRESAFTLIAQEDEDGLLREVCIAIEQSTGRIIWKKCWVWQTTGTEEEMQEHQIIAEEMVRAPHHRSRMDGFMSTTPAWSCTA